MEKMNLSSPLAKVLYVAGVTTFCTFLGCWAVLAHQDNTQGDKRTAVVSDEQFARNAAQSGLAEVKLGQLAQEKGTNDAVKQFGKRMVQDHVKANEELKAAAKNDGITLSRDLSLDDKEQATFEELSKLSGTAFDMAYARDMVREHWRDVSDFNHEANGGQKNAIKKFAGDALPALDDHLRQARDMRQIVASAAAAPTPASTKKKFPAQSGRR